MLLYTFPLLISLLFAATPALARCRTQPSDPGFPGREEWASLNASVDGRLLKIVPSALACADAGCSSAQWSSGLFRDSIPGQMNAYNWEQLYTANPPELCLVNATNGTCSQGNVPLYAINATKPSHIQAGVKFAAQHDLRIAIKSSGHDYLGRSTNRGALLLWTQYFKDIKFTDSFILGGEDLGSAVTVGSGAGLKAIYTAAKAEGKIFIGGTAATVSAGGGYTQGAGHSAFSPTFGLAADNVLQYELVLADGSLVTANSNTYTDLFWALRGGGAGSWGVITSITIRTYPLFDATVHSTNVTFSSSSQAAAGMRAHAGHVSDYDGPRGSQYYYLFSGGIGQGSLLQINTLFINISADAATALVAPLLADLRAVGANISDPIVVTAPASDIVGFADDEVGFNTLLGSRLVPVSAYQDGADTVEEVYKELLDFGVDSILGHIISGGKVAENANIDSAILPKWRTAKTHVIATTTWPDSTSAADVIAITQNFTATVLPQLARMTGESDSGSYSNEANVNEPDFRTTFFGPNYPRLSSIKSKYDPQDLFIVGAGVGSERWDADGICTINSGAT